MSHIKYNRAKGVASTAQSASGGAVTTVSTCVWQYGIDATGGDAATTDKAAQILDRLTITNANGTKHVALELDDAGNLCINGNVVSTGEVMAYGLTGTEVQSIKAYIDSIIGGRASLDSVEVTVSGNGNVVTSVTASLDELGNVLYINITKGINASVAGHTHDERYYTELEVDNKLSGYVTTSTAQTISGAKTYQQSIIIERPTDTFGEVQMGTASRKWSVSARGSADSHALQFWHLKDGQWTKRAELDVNGNLSVNNLYNKAEIDTKLGGKADATHTHDDRYYTEGEVDAKLSGKSDVGHTHTIDAIPSYARNSVGDCGWPTAADLAIRGSALAFWNGAFDGNASSNLRYCWRGELGDVVTHSHAEYVTMTGYQSISGVKAFDAINVTSVTVLRDTYGARLSHKSTKGRWDTWTDGADMAWSATNDDETAWTYDKVMRLEREGNLTIKKALTAQSINLSNNGHTITLSLDADGNLIVNGNIIARGGDVIAEP